jgi:hypothetical protein
MIVSLKLLLLVEEKGFDPIVHIRAGVVQYAIR